MVDAFAQLDEDMEAMETEEAAQNAPADEGVVVEAQAEENAPAAIPAQEIANVPSSIPRPAEPVYQMPENAAEVFPVDELLHSAHSREMLPLFRSDVPRGGPIFKMREHKPFFFGTNPYEKPRSAYSLRFWTQEQAIYYTRVLFNKARVFQIGRA